MAASLDTFSSFHRERRKLSFNLLNYLLEEFGKMNFFRGMLEILNLFKPIYDIGQYISGRKQLLYGTFNAVFQQREPCHLVESCSSCLPECQVLQRLKHCKNACFGKSMQYNSCNCKKSDLHSNTFKHS